jgi:glycosyltransferase involved in cell wall biosynthesis
MKVALLAPEFLPPWGGVGIYSFELARALCEFRDIELHVITPEREGAYSTKQIEKLFDGRVKVHYMSRANDTFFYNLKFQVALFRKFKALHMEHKFDLVHAANLVHMPDIFLKFQEWDIPFVTTIHTTLDGQSKVDGKKRHISWSLAPVEVLSRIAYPYIKGMQNAYLKRTKNFICVSEWVKEMAGVQAEVIHNGVDHRRFSPVKKQNKVPVVLYTGRLLAMKGIDCLIEAMKPLLEKHKMRLVVAGAGNIERYTKMLDGVNPEYFEFLGAVPYEEIHTLYQKADIFVMPSLTESFPLSVLEAMSSGVAVVSTRVGGVPEMLDHTTGLLVEPNNAEDLRTSIILLLEDKQLRQKLAGNARKRVQERLTAKKMARKTYEVYKSIL